MKYLIVILIAIIGFSSCKNRHRVAAAEANAETDSTQNADSTLVSDAFDDLDADFDMMDEEPVLFASISKGACFGRCPVYQIRVYNDGAAEFEGKNHVDYIGLHTATLSEELLNELEAKAKELGLDKMEDRYDNDGVTDLPSTVIGISIDGTFKEIIMRHGYPEALHEYRTYFDKVFEQIEWTKVADSDN